jgi:hypothetical protein
MTTTKHTPGPWRTGGSKAPFTVHRHNRVFGHVCADIQNWNDAALIASAPDLLAALMASEAWVGLYEGMPGHDAAAQSMLRVIRAAIAKATGA